ncbi:MAG TPA: 2,3-bisphosphoglycerate-independent phosphoglycerate mutase [Firmicutes bacterium]|nr:2,3-bisphosphoglycerate-independent phosphoglycerate mutase [Bacillota bacterium]
MKKPIVLCILDGCGLRDEEKGNAFKNAKKPTFDYLVNNYPHTILNASGKEVGLPAGQMGNSEVGHMNMGAGRVVYQPQELINRSIENGEFFKNEHILKIIEHTKNNNSKLHIMGLISDGGIHSRIEHLLAIMDMCKEQNVKEIYLHLFTDGRDTDIHSAPRFVKILEDKIAEIKIGKVVTVSGRYYAMDRDNNYDRLKLAYDAICYGIGEKYNTPLEVLDSQYKKDITDEFILPSIVNDGKLEDNDGIIVFNYRPDRLREMFTAITNPSEVPMETIKFNNVKLVSMMPITDTVKGLTAFEHQSLDNTLGMYLNNMGLSQLRIAETEKYAHVTYFFDGGKELELDKAKRILVASPKVATYDMKPEMSAEEVTDKLIAELDKDYLDVVILNYANGDMVGHTGVYEAAVKAVEFMDSCLKRLYDKVEEKDGILIVTADHGNCDVMINDDGTPCTTHTTNKVPFIVTKKEIELVREGKLADIAPTMLQLLNIPIPVEINGDSLIKQ